METTPASTWPSVPLLSLLSTVDLPTGLSMIESRAATQVSQGGPLMACPHRDLFHSQTHHHCTLHVYLHDVDGQLQRWVGSFDAHDIKALELVSL